MASGIHKSKEIYKYTPTNSGNQCVPIRGLYVSGLHTEPRYYDHLVTVVGFNSNEPEIRDYTTAYKNAYEPAIIVRGFQYVNPTAVDYTTQSKTNNTSGFIVRGFQFANPQVISYQTSNYENTDHGIIVRGFQFVPFSVNDYTYHLEDFGPTHVISIRSFESTEPEITDI